MTERSLQRRRTRVLWNLLNEIPSGGVPSSEGAICAVPIRGFKEHRLGRTRDGAVCLVIATASTGVLRPDVQLQNLRIQRRMTCEVIHPTGDRESLVGTVVTCRAESIDLKRFFLELFEQALESIGRSPTEDVVDRWIDHAMRLFSELEVSNVREIQGLWGELLVISDATDPSTLLRRWHEAPEDQFDFLSGTFALEVKTCSDLDRRHLFSLGQLRPTAGLEVLVASIHVRPDPNGTSVMDLIAEIERRVLNVELKEKLRRTAFRIGGSALAQPPRRFDRRTAAKSLRFIRAAAIPAIDQRLPPEVIHVQLSVRCRDIPGEDLGNYAISRMRD